MLDVVDLQIFIPERKKNVQSSAPDLYTTLSSRFQHIIKYNVNISYRRADKRLRIRNLQLSMHLQ